MTKSDEYSTRLQNIVLQKFVDEVVYIIKENNENTEYDLDIAVSSLAIAIIVNYVRLHHEYLQQIKLIKILKIINFSLDYPETLLVVPTGSEH